MKQKLILVSVVLSLILLLAGCGRTAETGDIFVEAGDVASSARPSLEGLSVSPGFEEGGRPEAVVLLFLEEKLEPGLERSSPYAAKNLNGSDGLPFTLIGFQEGTDGEALRRWFFVPDDLQALYEWKPEDAALSKLWTGDGEEPPMEPASFLLALVPEVKEYTLLDYGIAELEDGEYYNVAAGKNSPEKFTAEQYYYIPLDYRAVYEFDAAADRLHKIWPANGDTE